MKTTEVPGGEKVRLELELEVKFNLNRYPVISRFLYECNITTLVWKTYHKQNTSISWVTVKDPTLLPNVQVNVVETCSNGNTVAAYSNHNVVMTNLTTV